MNIVDLNKCISSSNYPGKFLVFYGKDREVMDIYLEQLAKRNSATITNKDTVGTALATAGMGSLVGGNIVYVIKEDATVLKEEKMWGRLEKNSKNFIIVIFSELDKRSKFFKKFKEVCVEFNDLPSTMVENYVVKGFGLSASNASKLVQMYNTYSRCMRECEKLESYACATNSSIDTCFELFEKEQLFTYERKVDLFEYSKALQGRFSAKCHEMVPEILSAKESALGFIAINYSAIRNLLLVQACPKGANITETTGISKGQAYYISQMPQRYTNGELVDNLYKLQEVDEMIKTGLIDNDSAIKFLDCYLLSRRN